MIKKVINVYKNMPTGIKVSFWFIFCSFFQKGINILISPIFNRILTLEEYGLYSIYNSWNGIFSTITSLSLSAGFVSVSLSNVKELKKRDRLISSIQGLATLISCFFFFLFLILHKSFEKFTSLPFIVLLFMFLFYIFQCSFSLCITKDKFNGKYIRMLITTILTSIISPLLTFIVLKNSNYKSVARIIVPIAVIISYEVVFFVYNFIKGRSFYDRNIWKEAIIFNLPLIPHYLANIVLASSDRIIIEKIVGLDEAGIYGLAYSISSLLNVLISPIYTSTQPWFYRCLDEKRIRDIRRVTSIITIALTLIIIFAILLGPELIYIFGSRKYYEANSILPILFLGEFLAAFYIQFIQVEFKYKKTKIIMVSSTMCAILNIILNYIFIPLYGYTAAAYTTLLCYFIYTIIHFIAQKIIVKQRIFSTKLYILLFSIVALFSIIEFWIYKILLLRILLLAILGIMMLIFLIYGLKKRKNILNFFK